MLRQTLQQKQQLKLTPQQMLVQKLLQFPVASVEQRIKEEIENNPALEEAPENEWEQKEEDSSNDEGSDIDTGFDDDASDFMEESDEYVPAYKLSVNNTSPDEERAEIPVAATTSFRDSLITQLNLRNLNERQCLLAEYIIGNIDDDGYLRRDLYSIANDITFLQNMRTDENELIPLLEIIQEFDPAGVGARDLRECLLIQLKRKPQHTASLKLATDIIERAFEEFSHKNYEKIKEIVHADDKQVKAAIDEIVKLNPKPGETYSEEQGAIMVVPDFIVNIDNGEPDLILNDKTSSKVRLSPLYLDMVESKDKKDKLKREAVSFARQRMEAARNFLGALKQREETMLKVMHAILDYQKDYFMEGDQSTLKPMLLKNIAKVTGLDISTISRVVNSKYVQTAQGTILLKTLFSESFEKESGEEVSVNEVKNAIKEIIDAEDKKAPLNDEVLVEMLEKKGYKVARRTIAKYREQLNIPIARMRKEM
jgi:RNA polymerase sigma-54 factor